MEYTENHYKGMRTKVIIFIIITLFSMIRAFCKENSNAEGVLSLKEIDLLIRNNDTRDFQRALDELNKYFVANPNEFDAVQQRIKLIMKSRDLYSSYVNQLVQIIKEGKEDKENELKEITDKLINLERNPGDSRLDIIKDTNYLVSIYQYSAIQNKTKELIDRQDYKAAAIKASEGLKILWENFDLKYGDEQVGNQVKTYNLRLKKLVELYCGIEDRFESAVSAYLSALKKDNEAQIDDALVNVRSVFTDAAKIRNEILEIGNFFKEKNTELKRKPVKVRKTQADEQDIFLKHGDDYLGLAAGSIFGWKENPDPDHGILGVLDAQWNISVEKMKADTINKIRGLTVKYSSSNSVAEFKENGILPDIDVLRKIHKYAGYGKTVNGLYALLKDDDGKNYKSVYPNYNGSIDYVDELAVSSNFVVSGIYGMAEAFEKAMKSVSAKKSAEQELLGYDYSEGLLEAVSLINEQQKNIINAKTKKKPAENNYIRILEEKKKISINEKKRTMPGVQVNDEIIDWHEFKNTTEGFENAAGSYADKVVSRIYVTLAQYYADCGIVYVKQATKEADAINKLISGDSSSGSSRRYSKNAVLRTSELTDYIFKAREILSSGLKKITSSYSDTYLSYSSSISSSIDQLDSIIIKSKETLVVAEKLVKRAETNKRKGDESMRDSRKSLSRENYDKATDQAYKANDYYIEALKDNYDEEFSKSSSLSVTGLLTEIKEKQKVYIFDEVDTLMAQANEAYRNDNYSEAQKYLSRAQERWSIVFPELENGEIANLNSIIDIALRANNGRYPTDKVSEINQILSIANQNYDKGLALSKKDNRSEAAEEFNKALKKLDELKVIAPRNKDANILRFKIQQYQDPKQFEQKFDAMVQQAKLDYKKKDKQVQVYSDLKDLAEMNPAYPGLKELILEIEYEMGIKIRITDTSKSESAALYAEAKKIFDAAGSNQERLKSAMAKIDQAIAKFNGNREAKSLKNKIRVKLESQVVNVTFEVNEKYQEAMDLYNAYDYAGANEIIEKIWADSRNHTDKIDKLRKRIKAELI